MNKIIMLVVLFIFAGFGISCGNASAESGSDYKYSFLYGYNDKGLLDHNAKALLQSALSSNGIEHHGYAGVSYTARTKWSDAKDSLLVCVTSEDNLISRSNIGILPGGCVNVEVKEVRPEKFGTDQTDSQNAMTIKAGEKLTQLIKSQIDPKSKNAPTNTISSTNQPVKKP